MESTRTIEYWDYDTEEWVNTGWDTVVSGMMVRMFEQDGTPILGAAGIYEMYVVSDSYIQTISGSGDIWTINIADNPGDYITKTDQ